MLSIMYRNFKVQTLAMQLKFWVTVLILMSAIFIMLIFTYDGIHVNKGLAGLFFGIFFISVSWFLAIRMTKYNKSPIDRLAQEGYYQAKIETRQMADSPQELQDPISEARYRAIVEDQTELICRYLPGGLLTYVNMAYCRYFNKPREQLVDTSFIPLIPEEDHALILQHMASISQENPVVTMEHRVILPDGQVRWQQWTDRAIFGANEQIVEYQAVGRDVTERVTAQLALQQAHDELDLRVKQRTAELQKSYSALEAEIQERKKAEAVLQRYKLLVEQAHDIILMIDIDSFQIIDANEAAVSAYGYSREELLTRKTHELLGPGATRLDKEHIQQLLEKGLLFESVHRRHDGSCFPVDVSIFGCIRQGQRVVMGIIRDITERKQAEKEMLNAREQIARTERLASLGTMAAGIAHEINQPLNSIKVTADSLLYWYKKGKEHKFADIVDDIEGVSVQAGRIDKIIKHMRAMVHGQNVACQCIDLNYAVEGALDLIQSQLERHGIKITKLLDPELPQVRGDVTQLEGVVVNLTLNAMQSLNAKERINKEIILKTYADEHVMLEIIDNGTGIDDETREKIFTPFFTTKPVGEGMGIGLCIVHSVVASSNGEIHVSKNDSGGATFQIKIPKA
jgi:PAS domain S-box-containing protein